MNHCLRFAVLDVLSACHAAGRVSAQSGDCHGTIVNSRMQNRDGASCTWFLVDTNKNQKNPVKAKQLVDFMRWALNDGEQLHTPIVASLDERLNAIMVAD